LPSVDAPGGENSSFFQEVDPHGCLTKLTGHSYDGVIRRMTVSFEDGRSESCGETDIDCSTDVEFPEEMDWCNVKLKLTTEKDIAGLEFESMFPSGNRWNASVGESRADSVTSKHIRGPLIGISANNIDERLHFGLVSSPFGTVTPLYGHSDTGKFFETGCLYGLDSGYEHFAFDYRVYHIGAWFDRGQSTLNGLQVKQGYIKDRRRTYDIGTLNGNYSEIILGNRAEISMIEIAMSNSRTMIYGLRFTIHCRTGEIETEELGQMQGGIYHLAFQSTRELIGVYGMCNKDTPCSIGFVVSDA